MTPIEAIRKQCLYCMIGQSKEVELCTSPNCHLFYCRFGKNRTNPRRRALLQIRDYCYDCSGSYKERRDCWDTECPLYPYRLGKNPACADRPGNAANLPCSKKAPGKMPDFEH